MIGPLLERIAGDCHNVKSVRLNTDVAPVVAQQFKAKHRDVDVMPGQAHRRAGSPYG
jgi:hypothetical protein